MLYKFFVALCLLCRLTHAGEQVLTANPCKPADVGGTTIVCVCNATYCDDVEPNSRLPLGLLASYSSSIGGLRLHKQIHNFTRNENEPSDSAFVKINRSTAYQEILGFGGAFTDAATLNIASLSTAAQDKLLASYYSSSGIQYSTGRIPMASCDFSTHQYSYCDWPNDFGLSNFSLAMEDLKYKIPTIQKASSMHGSNLTLFGSPWSCPAWMKSNHNMTGGGTLLGEPGGKYYDTWALYFAKFIQAYEKQGVPIWGVTVENEPAAGLQTDYPFQALGFTADMERDFVIKNLGPILETQGFGDVKILMMDDQRLFLPLWVDTILSSEKASKYISGIGIHWYVDLFTKGSIMTDVHNKYPDKFLLYTEACCDALPLSGKINQGDWQCAERYAHNIIQDLNNWVVGWTDWNLALDMNGGPSWMGNRVTSPIIVNSASDEFYKQPMFYIMGHFSKFLPPGSKRINISVTDVPLLYSVAFQAPDSSTVLILLNRNDLDILVTVHDEAVGTAQLLVQAHSIQTVVWWTE